MLKEFIQHTLKSEELYLVPERALWWAASKTLILSDLHLGKATHFNKHGMALPNLHSHKDLELICILAEGLEAERLLILGDVFHSSYNTEFQLLNSLAKRLCTQQIEIVQGNHDILDQKYYADAGLILHTTPLIEGPFIFVHDVKELKNVNHDLYPISGHIHPGIRLYGKGRQSLRLPCFYFGERYAVLPAYGSLTGLHTVRHESDQDKIYGIAGEKIAMIPNTFKSPK
ncbi:ligase-associated DNA damage response endonuclease PdeM [soil metagenome]